MKRARYVIGLPLFIGMIGWSYPATADQSMLFDHNGSQVRLDVRAGAATIRYAEPRPGLAAAGINRNAVLFEGRINPDGGMQGSAYTYAVGCAPAAYAVSGVLRGGGMLLRGPAPRRERGGCAITGYDPQSPHALLAFNAVSSIAVNPNNSPSASSNAAAALDAAPAIPPTQPKLPSPQIRPDPIVSDYDRLMDAYLAGREKLKSDADFAQAFAQFTDCENYARIRSNEFERDRFNTAAVSMIQGRGLVSGPLHLRLAAKLGTYEFDRKAFAFRPFAISSVYNVAPPKDYGCGARHSALPEGFAVRFENFDLVDGIPLAPDVAEEMIKGRTPRPGLRDDNVIIDLDIEFAGKVDDPKDVEIGGLLRDRKRLAAVSATIVDYAVYANASAPQPFARLGDARKKAYVENKERIAADDAADAKANQEFSWSLLTQQFNALKAGPSDFSGKRTRLGFPGSLVRDAAKSDGTRFRINALGAGWYYEQRSSGSRVGVNLQFVNPNPSETIELPADLALRVNQNPSAAKLNRLYIPVGVIDDEAAGRSTVMGQIVGLEVEVDEDGHRDRHVIAVPGELKPFRFRRDERVASAFEIMGLKVGMSPEAFTEIAAQFGEKAAYDPVRRKSVSASAHCAAASLTSFDDKPCPSADFDVVGRGWLGGDNIALTRLIMSQGLRRDQLGSFISGFKQELGEPRVERTSGNVTLLAWGAVVAKERDLSSSVQANWHVVELEIRNTPMGAMTRFMVTDPVFLANRAGGPTPGG